MAAARLLLLCPDGVASALLFRTLSAPGPGSILTHACAVAHKLVRVLLSTHHVQGIAGAGRTCREHSMYAQVWGLRQDMCLRRCD